MNIILLGKPGSGKGSQAKKLAEQFDLTHLCTGDEFRRIMLEEGPLTDSVKPFMLAGQLVPDQETCLVVQEFLRNHPDEPIVWDGFPRNLLQAEWLKQEDVKPDMVIVIDLPDQEAIDRSTSRRVCQSCGKIHSLTYHPPRDPERCDDCGSPLFQRADDQEEIVRGRLTEYRAVTEPLVGLYRTYGKLWLVPGGLGRDQLFQVLCFLVEQGRVKE